MSQLTQTLEATAQWRVTTIVTVPRLFRRPVTHVFKEPVNGLEDPSLDHLPVSSAAVVIYAARGFEAICAGPGRALVQITREWSVDGEAWHPDSVSFWRGVNARRVLKSLASSVRP